MPWNAPSLINVRPAGYACCSADLAVDSGPTDAYSQTEGVANADL
jgi:hypothetical protein